MRRVRTGWIAAAMALGLVSCAPSGPRLSAEEAHGVLENFARGRAPADICTPEGRALLRSATRTYAKAQEAAGLEWPDMRSLVAEDSADIASIDALALASVAAGFIEPSDLRGSARTLSGFISLAQHNEIGDMRRAVRHACTEVFAMHQSVARQAIEVRRYERARDNAARFGPERLREVERRFAPRLERMQREMQRRTEAVEAKLRTVPEDGG